MGNQAIIIRCSAATKGNHGVLHAVPRVSYHHFRIGIRAELLFIGIDHLGCKVGDLQPVLSLMRLYQRYTADTPCAGYTHPVGGISGKGKVMHVLRMVLPGLQGILSRVVFIQLVFDLSIGGVIIVFNSDQLQQLIRQRLAFIHQGSGALHDVLPRQG